MTSKPKLKNLFIRSKEINLLTTTLKLKKKIYVLLPKDVLRKNVRSH